MVSFLQQKMSNPNPNKLGDWLLQRSRRQKILRGPLEAEGAAAAGE
jgi:hypothetical protein